MTRIARLKKQFPGEFHAGERIANRLHVGTSNLAVIRACRKALKRTKANFAREARDARHALFRGALESHKRNRDLFVHFRF